MPSPQLLLLSIFLALPLAAQAPLAATASPAQRMWWNQSRFVDALGLTEAQRQGLDGLLEETLGERREQARRYRALRQAFAAALEAGDWAEAEAQSAELAAAAAAVARGEAELVLAAVRRLTAEQRQQVQAEFPALLQRPWLRGGMGGGVRRQGGGGEARPGLLRQGRGGVDSR